MQKSMILAEKVWGTDDAEYVMSYLKDKMNGKKTFRNENAMMNFISRILTSECKSLIKRRSDEMDFWAIRVKSIAPYQRSKSKAKNILLVIKYLQGDLTPYSEIPEPDYDFHRDENLQDMKEESFWEDLEMERNYWV